MSTPGLETTGLGMESGDFDIYKKGCGEGKMVANEWIVERTGCWTMNLWKCTSHIRIGWVKDHMKVSSCDECPDFSPLRKRAFITTTRISYSPPPFSSNSFPLLFYIYTFVVPQITLGCCILPKSLPAILDAEAITHLRFCIWNSVLKKSHIQNVACSVWDLLKSIAPSQLSCRDCLIGQPNPYV